MRKLLIYFFTAETQKALSLRKTKNNHSATSAVILFCFAFPQVFHKIRQTDHYGSQAHHIPGIDPTVKHSGNDSGKRQAHNGSDYEN